MQPQPPQTRQSGPQAKKTGKDTIHVYAPGGKPGGPILPSKQGFENPGPTTNLRGVEANTEMHRGTPNPEQRGTEARHGDHNPGMAEAGMDHGRQGDGAPTASGRTGEHSKKVPPPMPDPRGVRK